MLSGGASSAKLADGDLHATANPSLLDEHTAALDPARAELITRITDDIVRDMKLTTLMVT